MKRFIYNWAPVLVFLILIFGTSTAPVNIQSPWDKFLHVLQFLIFGFLISRSVFLSWNLTRFQGILLSAGLGMSGGIVSEFIQLFLRHRQFSWFDGLANVVGVWLGVIVFVMTASWIFQSRRLYRSNINISCSTGNSCDSGISK